MANTFIHIATASNAGSAGELTFSSIPSTYTDLALYVNGRSTRNTGGTGTLGVKVNGSAIGNNYRGVATGSVQEYGTSTSHWYISYAPQNPSADSWADNIFAHSWTYFFNYSDSNYQKSAINTNLAVNSTGYGPSFFGYNTNSGTTTISSITIYNPEGFNPSAYTTAYLFGIKKD